MMLEEIFQGFTVSDSFKTWIHDESEGIPFYIEELVKMLLEEGSIQRSGNEVQLRNRINRFCLIPSARLCNDALAV